MSNPFQMEIHQVPFGDKTFNQHLDDLIQEEMKCGEDELAASHAAMITILEQVKKMLDLDPTNQFIVRAYDQMLDAERIAHARRLVESGNYPTQAAAWHFLKTQTDETNRAALKRLAHRI